MTPAERNFYNKVPTYIHRFRSDMPLANGQPCGKWDAVAVFGNAGHESLGFTALQEFKPIVAGSRGGYGWMQWTGPRRVAFEGFCQRKGFNVWDEEAQYQYILHELRNTSEKKAMSAMFAKTKLEDKVVAFEQNYLRAHPKYKHYDARQKWARLALEAYEAYLDKNPGLSTQPLKPQVADESGEELPLPDNAPPPTSVNPKVVVAGGGLAALVALGYALIKWIGGA